MKRRYRIGIDVGLKSVGLACIEVDDSGMPIRILNAQSVIHDGGVDPQKNKEAITRKNISGVARRTRRMRRRRRERLEKLDVLLKQYGYPIIDPDTLHEPFAEWVIRAKAADEFISDEEQRKEAVSVAIRHIARHRGWRNPYHRAESLLNENDYSEQYVQLLEKAEDYLDRDLPDGLTPAQIVAEALSAGYTKAPRLRTGSVNREAREGLLPTKLMQEDNANELKDIFFMQRVSEEESRRLLLAVFYAHSPKGSAEHRVGIDPFDHNPRALKASLVFQRYRIASMVANLYITENGSQRPLSVSEKETIYDNLTTQSTEEITWSDIAEVFGWKRSQIKGVGSLTADGEERVTSRPPRLNFLQNIFGCKDKKLRVKLIGWWKNTEDSAHEAMISLLSNTVDVDKVHDDPYYEQAIGFIDQLDDEELTKLDTIDLQSGRAAYSTETLLKLTHQILTTTDNLHEARKHIFGVNDNWRPAAEKIGAPVGNPAVDRVLKIVNRYLICCRNRWGEPVSVQIEHVRDALSSIAVSEKNKRAYENMTGKRSLYREELRRQLRGDEQIDRPLESDLRRMEAIQRQNGQCLYCGRGISFRTCEMDHIVPRKGAGSTNTRNNLAAVCAECNRAKSNVPFAVWAKTSLAISRGVDLKEAIERVKAFLFDPRSYSPSDQRAFKQAVIMRLKQFEADDEIDNRSIESVAWMADELHRRIDWFYNAEHYTGALAQVKQAEPVKVNVYQGRITADARKASGIEGDIHFVGARYKTRLDRRHHAVDAAVIAMMNHGVAMTLSERGSLRESQFLTGLHDGEVSWKQYPYPGSSGYDSYQHWLGRMKELLGLLNEALDCNRVKILQWQRMSLGNSIAHDATIHALDKCELGSAIDANTIRKASTPALYCALTRLPDYDETNGLPENPDRVIHVNGQRFNATDMVSFFMSNAAQIAVQGGSADIGSAIHHARIYRCWKESAKGKRKYFYGMIRVFQVDLLKSSHSNLFTVALPESAVSLRYGEARTIQAVLNGHAEYLGYLLVGDTIRVDFARSSISGQIEELINFFDSGHDEDCNAYNSWVVSGFFSESRLRLRPQLLAAEGISNLQKYNNIEVPEGMSKIVTGQGWLPSVDAIAKFFPQVVRVNTFGESREKSRHGLPTSWKWCK
ncbi:type II CRISPR RNA-guided endonuclease Cas9 [Bifidobacterium oedipodis]|uniref:Restriction endonuclease n=1 Tax=Bifidobacterium oedipodis TaxID=2675322 RepID=A0A7Y0HSP3_9BIFI|nr:type II CRISPR RNA-guided endonuclease Cas9 [Bifidobacterium sp. DSM 109957]NMM93813.1 Restriction endonuclease [Bifidobacterium sp. DSM 109957]